MRIEGVGSTPVPPAAPAGPAFPVQQPQAQQTNLAALALQQAEEKGGGGGGGHHGKKTSLAAIEDLAARASLKIEPRQKTVAERIAEIERMKALHAAAAEKVGAKQGGEGDGEDRPPGHEGEDDPETPG